MSGTADPLLSTLVQAVEGNHGNWIGVTLSVKGVVIAGLAVSSSEYLQGLAEELRRAALEEPDGQSASEAVADAFSEISEQVQQADLPDETAHIHLKEARILAGLDMVPDPGMWWRGRLDEIDGFALGLLSLP